MTLVPWLELLILWLELLCRAILLRIRAETVQVHCHKPCCSIRRHISAKDRSYFGDVMTNRGSKTTAAAENCRRLGTLTWLHLNDAPMSVGWGNQTWSISRWHNQYGALVRRSIAASFITLIHTIALFPYLPPLFIPLPLRTLNQRQIAKHLEGSCSLWWRELI